MSDFNIENAVTGMANAFEEFKKVNDQRLDQIEAKGSVDPLLQSKVDTLESEMAKYDNINNQIAAQKAKDEQIEEKLLSIETMLARPSQGLDVKSVNQTMQTFEKWIRKGDDFLDQAEKKALTVGTAATAGNLAPTEYVEELIKIITEISPVRSVARVRQTSNKDIDVPSKTASFAAAWSAENGSRTETTGYTTSLNTIATHELYAMVDISQQLLEDSVFDLESEMNLEFAEQFAKAEGAAFISGNGTNKPFGLTNGSTVGTGATAASQTAITVDELMTLVHSLKTDYARNASFMLNRTTLGEIRKLKDTNGQYIFQAGFSGQSGLPNTILGHSYVEAPDCADMAADAKPIIFGDFRRGYMIVDRVNMSVLRDGYTQAASGNVRYLARRRVGGEVVLPEAMKVLAMASA
jgi:HK97 family phage major capsid protein